jgi:small-conductance mechanosensitive channel
MTPENFFQNVLAELNRSLRETFGIFGRGPEDISASFARILTQLLVALLIILLFSTAYWLLKRVVRGVTRRSKVLANLTRPLLTGLRYVMVLLTSLAVLSQFGLSPALLAQIGIAALFAFAFYLTWVVTNRLMTNTLRMRGFDRSLEQLLRNLLAVLIVAFGAVTVLNQVGINVLSVITALGVVGIAVGFAAQETIANFISGITLLIERPFRIGDWVVIGDIDGRVEEITLRTTRIVTLDNSSVAIPNASVASSMITDFSAGGPLRVTIPVGIAYKESVKAARAVILPILENHSKVLKAPTRQPAVMMRELGDSSVNLWVLYWIAPEDIPLRQRLSSELLESIKEALDAAGIEIPFPHLQLFIDDAEGLKPVLEPLYPNYAYPPKD